jgi:cytochrome b561
MTAARRYSNVAMALHWLIALTLIGMVPVAWWMTDAIRDPDQRATAYQIYQLHKSAGLTILGLTLLRLTWRLMHPAPPLPAGMKSYEAFAAHATHVAFYALTILIPLSGWIYVSAAWSIPDDRPLNVATSWFGLFTVPHLPGLTEASDAMRRWTAVKSMSAHSLLVWGAIVLVALHIGAALKHQFVDRDGLLARMVPWMRVKDTPVEAAEPRRAAPILAGIAAVLALASFAAIFGEAEEHETVAEAPPAIVEAAPDTAPPPAAAPVEAIATPPSAASNAVASAWTVDRSRSAIRFAGEQAGAAFNGRFERWSADIRFDPRDLAGSRALVRIETGSARTGDATQEGSLLEKEWFDPKGFPAATFEAKAFRALGGNRYAADGALTIKSKTVPVTLPFTFQETDQRARVSGAVEVDRTAFDLGLASDPNGEWVSKIVRVAIEVEATRAP